MDIRCSGKKITINFIILLIFWLIFCSGSISWGSNRKTTIYLSNGDRISGTIIFDDKEHIVITNDLLGNIKIKKSLMEKIDEKKEVVEISTDLKKQKPKLWKTELTLGVAMSEGNTISSSFSGDLLANRKTEDNEFTLKGSGSYASTKREMDTQKWYGMIRYAYSFLERKWYNFYKFETDHDMFANINYRLLPSTGIGYWFSDQPEFKAMTEIALGFENTYFRDDSPTRYETVLIPRLFLEKRLIGKTTISQEIVLYPSMNYWGDYRFHFATSLKNPLTDELFLRLSFIDDYNSSPSNVNIKRNDIQFITSLGYTF